VTRMGDITPQEKEDKRRGNLAALGLLPPKVELKRAYKFRIYPMQAQAAELSEWERQLRKLWNLAQEQRMASLHRWRDWDYQRGKCPACGKDLSLDIPHGMACDFVDYFRQAREMTALLSMDDQLSRVVCSARQEILRDLDKAWQRWRKKLGGRPRFKRRTDSCRIYFSTTKAWSIDGKYLSFGGAASSVGKLRIVLDRPWPEGAVLSSCSIVRDVDRWYAVFPLTYLKEISPAPERSVGINRGAVHAIADSDGRVIESPRFYVRALDRMRRHARVVSRRSDRKKARPSSSFIKLDRAKERLAKDHRKVRLEREWWLHQQSRYYAKNFNLVALEDEKVKQILEVTDDDRRERPNMPWNKLHRSILDVGWYELARQIDYKRLEHASALVRVKPGPAGSDEELPRGVSSSCAACGEPFSAPATGKRKFMCTSCLEKGLGDVNAAENILKRAQGLPAPSAPKERKTVKIKGRQKRPLTPPNLGGEASGGDPFVRGPVERGTPECVVQPNTDMRDTGTGFS